MITFGLLATISDPTDPTVYEERTKKDNNLSMNSENYEYFCKICDTHVLNKSKHCGTCNRCVNDFDHHCKWLNNCVGKKNYNYFIYLVSFSMIETLFQIGCYTFYIIKYFCDSSLTSNINDLYKINLYFAPFILVCLIFAENMAFVMFLSHLIFFHIRLKIKGMTTYEYILYRREQKEMKNVPKLPHKSKVVVRISDRSERHADKKLEDLLKEKEDKENDKNKIKYAEKLENMVTPKGKTLEIPLYMII